MMLALILSAFEQSLLIAFHWRRQPEHLVSGKVTISSINEDSVGLLTFATLIKYSGHPT